MAGGACIAVPMLATIVANVILLVKVFNYTRRLGEALPNRGQISSQIISARFDYRPKFGEIPTHARYSNPKESHSSNKIPIISGAIVTILWVCLAFFISYTPQFTDWVIEAGGRVVPPWGILLVTYCLAINVISNPVIYVVSNRRFKSFVIGILSSGPSVASATFADN